MDRIKASLSRKSTEGDKGDAGQKRYKPNMGGTSGPNQPSTVPSTVNYSAGLGKSLAQSRIADSRNSKGDVLLVQAPSTAAPVNNQKASSNNQALDLPQSMRDLKLRDERRDSKDSVFQGKVVEGDPNQCGHIICTVAGSGANKQTINYSTERVVGNGSFGVVFQATCLESGETVAIKKVLQDKRFKNRELQIMKMMSHPNVVSLKHCFYSTTEKEEVYLNLVLEFVPETVFRISKHYSKSGQRMPTLFVKLYVFQMCRALAHIHAMGVCHRDIKPQNLLVNTHTHQLKLCDFGSAKVLVRGEPNISYICSRYYRAPELIFGATDYTTAIDLWSVGCVMAELLLGQPLFPGESGVDQLVEIIKVLGTPTREDIHAMNPNYTEFKFPHIKAHPWSKVFSKRLPADAVDLVSRLLQYSPVRRYSALQALTHPFFDELRDQSVTLPNGRDLPPLFNWQKGELDHADPAVAAALQPGAAASSSPAAARPGGSS